MILSLLAAATLQAAAPAADSEQARFSACATLVRTDPVRAVDEANAWRTVGGGVLAQQCLGLAYVAQERWAPAATVYEQAARDAAGRSDGRAADLWVQAGNAWLAAREPTKAVQALDAALATTTMSAPLRGQVHLDRARALVALGNLAGARADIDRALQMAADDGTGWYLSAALARRTGDLPRAGNDIARALTLKPDDPDFNLLAGTIAGAAGDMAEAEARYRRVVELAPSSEAAAAAQASLGTAEDSPPQ